MLLPVAATTRCTLLFIQALSAGPAVAMDPGTVELGSPVPVMRSVATGSWTIDFPELQALREVGAPEALIDAVEAALSSDPSMRRLGVSARAVIEFPGESPDKPVQVVFAFGSSYSLNRPESARAKAALKAKGQIVSAAWEPHLIPAPAFPQFFDGLTQRAHIEGMEVNAWDGEGGWSWNLSICPLAQVTVKPEEVEAAWAQYHSGLGLAARAAARAQEWKICRAYLTEHLKRQGLDLQGEVTRLWLDFFDGPKAGDRTAAANLLVEWKKKPDRQPLLLDLLEFLITADLDDLALEALRAYRE